MSTNTPYSPPGNAARLAIDTGNDARSGNTTDARIAIYALVGVVLGLLIGGLVDRGFAVIGCFIGFIIGSVVGEARHDARLRSAVR